MATVARTVFVIGLGLIGGSIALAIRREHDVHMIGYDVNEQQLHIASSLKIIDEVVPSIEDGVKDADLIVLATPVKISEKILDQLAGLQIKEDTIITDVGSTKQQIFERAALLESKGITFIGGHPMAGSHKSGVEAARAHLFENAFYILTPMENTNVKKVIQLQNWLKGTKAKFIELTANQHDMLAGAISHFPHIIAASLVHQVAKIENDDPLVSQLAAGGFRDITRIASGSPIMWRDILIHNKDCLLDMLDKWQEEMNYVKQLIEHSAEEEIQQYFSEAKHFRDGLPLRKKGAIPSFYDLFVDVPDHPGVISDVTGILANEGISITNIRIIETREDIMGALRLSFRSDADREEAKKCLEAELYETYLTQ